MDSCVGVEREVDKILTKFNTINDHANRVLQDITNHVENLKQEFELCPPDHELTVQQVLIVKQTLNKVRDTVTRLTTDHRDLHSSVSRVGKCIDRHFTADFASCSREEVFSGPENERLLNQVICQHFYQQGMLDIAEYLAEEAGLTLEEEKTEPFSEINKILESLKKKDVTPALQWAVKHKEYLETQNSSLEFKLHQLQFITLIQKGMSHQAEAMQYARTHLTQYVQSHEKEIQNLMGMFLYLPQGLSGSPYAHYLTPTLWAEINELFMRDACNFLGLSIDSPLSICINAGCNALPALLNIKQAMQQRQVTGIWNGKDELPIEIDIGPDHQYHSVFACPILRQQSSELNPPMRLVCGHVISRDALNKLGNNANKLKCPYCPVEQNTSEAMLISF
ncbi:E3 ubiquitin-protein ligase RMND5A isoform X3 [Planococcus citri]|uniref:E3 ubiquitin-protein ligase RMND5A isoform X3 n=1 Tax=Planococcus citri TaxID=170843 RepID=UPI0031F72AEF